MKLRPLSPPLALLCNLGLAYLLYFLCRVVYILEFWDIYAAGWHQLSVTSLLRGGFLFDTSAILYTHILYAALLLLPWPRKWYSSHGWQLTAKILYIATNTLMLSINLVDTVYSRYTGRRTTATFFTEFASEGNLGHIFFIELLHHWYLLLIGIAFLVALIALYRPVRPFAKPLTHYLTLSLSTLLFVPLSVVGMRGGASTAIRPITISNANQYVNQPSEAAIVLNTPFSLIRTMGKTTFTDPHYFTNDQLDLIYTPIHQGTNVPANNLKSQISNLNSKNVVILIVESLAREYIGFHNSYPCHTPFLDSLIGQSLTFSQSYANGRKSIDALPSILSGIPMFVEPFILTSYSLNNVSSVAGELGKEGYTTAFFHGAENSSMGFQAFARSSGFARYYGRTEYCADPRFHGMDDFDGTWAIWDEEFLQFYAQQMNDLPQPFCTALFTATSHHPFVIPGRYRSRFQQEGHPMYTCIRYVDHALQHFFATASQMPWFENTIFVITADHTNHSERPEYSSPLGPYSVPIIIYDPSGSLPRGISPVVAQQTDIMPTLLGLLGYTRPYLAYGIDLLNTPAADSWALHYNNGIYQLVRPGRLLLFDGQRTVGYQSLDASTPPPADSTADLHLLQAIIQSYMQRMVDNQLVIGDENNTQSTPQTNVLKK
ncbi:MAG: sulfatase-like hydrolase/transferase [Bacteroidales bacterium]|nr:sulfatase-like hydrolase/transferase [Bacteroidales bacterium]